MTEEKRTIRILVVDDSAFMRRALTRLLNEGRDLEVVGVACNGKEALARIPELQPDVITLDVEMPEMDGVEALQRIMRDYPRPVVMLSNLTRRGADITLRCLEIGAVDFISKPSGSISEDVETIRYLIWHKVRAAASARIRRVSPVIVPSAARPAQRPMVRGAVAKTLVAIGASTGGPRALFEVLSALPATLPAGLLIVQHMPAQFTAAMAQRFDDQCALTVREAKEGDSLYEGTALIAPGGVHMRLSRSRTVRLSTDPPRWGVRPAVDYMLEDAAAVFSKSCLGIVLTGMGHDGTEGLAALHRQGGTTWAEDESTCVVYGMPRSAVEAGVVQRVLPLPEIAEEIVSWCNAHAKGERG